MNIALTPRQQQLLDQMTHLKALDALVPPMLEEAIGYSSTFMGKLPMMRFVAFYWGGGDEVMFDDGATSATGDWGPYLHYVCHYRVAPLLQAYDFGSSEDEPRHYLLLDREARQLYAASVELARVFLHEQQKKLWSHSSASQELSAQGIPPLIVHSAEELMNLLRSSTGWQEVQVDQQEVHKAMQRAQALYTSLALWLDAQP